MKTKTKKTVKAKPLTGNFSYSEIRDYWITDVPLDPANPTQPLDMHDLTDNLDEPHELHAEWELVTNKPETAEQKLAAIRLFVVSHTTEPAPVAPTKRPRLTFLDDCDECHGLGVAGGCSECGKFL